MDTKLDDRFENKKEPHNESQPASPASSTADNASVQHKPTIEHATHLGKADKMEDNSTEDRKHTP